MTVVSVNEMNLPMTKEGLQHWLDLHSPELERWTHENVDFHSWEGFKKRVWSDPNWMSVMLHMLRQDSMRNNEKVDAILAEMAQHSGLYLVLGAMGCLPKGTLIKTPSGLKPIENCKEVLSYNFSSGKIEPKDCLSFNSGKKKIVEITTPFGILRCSPEHKWLVKSKKTGKISVLEAKALNIHEYKLLLV